MHAVAISGSVARTWTSGKKEDEASFVAASVSPRGSFLYCLKPIGTESQCMPLPLNPQMLDLSQNYLGDQAASAFAMVLSRSQTSCLSSHTSLLSARSEPVMAAASQLSCIHVSDNSCTIKGLLALTSALACQPRLQEATILAASDIQVSHAEFCLDVDAYIRVQAPVLSQVECLWET